MDRNARIEKLALAIQELTAPNTRLNSYADTKRVNDMAEGIRLLAKMPDNFIENNIDNFDALQKEAERIIEASQ